MIRTPQIQNGFWPWPRPFQGWFVISRLGLATVNLPTKFENSISTRYEDIKGDAKCFHIFLRYSEILVEICQLSFGDHPPISQISLASEN